MKVVLNAQEVERLVALLPSGERQVFQKKETIYNFDQVPNGLYLVVNGEVLIVSNNLEQRVVAHGICPTNTLLGLQSQIPTEFREKVYTINGAELLFWPADCVERVQRQEPQRLSLFLMKAVIRESSGCLERLQEFQFNLIPRRLGLALAKMAEEVGTRQENGFVDLRRVSHEFLSQLVGTSREIVTQEIGELSKMGLIRRPGQKMRIMVDLPKLKFWLTENRQRRIAA